MKLLRTILAVVVLCSVVSVYTKDKKKEDKKSFAKKEADKKALAKKEADRKAFAKKEAERIKADAKKAKQQALAAKPKQAAVIKQQQAMVAPQPAGPAKKVSMDVYLNNKVSALQGDLINDIFPRKATIERIVLEFKSEYPGPDREGDTALIYETIINNPAIKSMITLDNAVQVYKLLRETIDNIWTKQDELIWAR